jgi:hypothetical protein
MTNSAKRLKLGDVMSGNAGWVIVCGAEICGIALTFWIELSARGRFVDTGDRRGRR